MILFQLYNSLQLIKGKKLCDSNAVPEMFQEDRLACLYGGKT